MLAGMAMPTCEVTKVCAHSVDIPRAPASLVHRNAGGARSNSAAAVRGGDVFVITGALAEAKTAGGRPAELRGGSRGRCAGKVSTTMAACLRCSACHELFVWDFMVQEFPHPLECLRRCQVRPQSLPRLRFGFKRHEFAYVLAIRSADEPLRYLRAA